MKMTRVLDFWVQTTLEDYIIEFGAEDHLSFSKADAMFKYGVKGRLLKEIPLWIKVLMVQKNYFYFQDKI